VRGHDRFVQIQTHQLHHQEGLGAQFGYEGRRLHQVRSAGVVRIEEIPKPTVSDHEVLVKVHVATVNRTDCGFRSAKPFIVRGFSRLVRPKVTVLGTEFAGVVEAVGSGVTSLQVADRVFGYSEGRWGAHAQYLKIPQDGPIATMPTGVPFELAAPSTEASHYARASIRKMEILSEQDVLVNGATGAIGSAAVQLLNTMSANVTAVCDTPNVELVKGLGADRVIDRPIEDFTKDNQTYHVVSLTRSARARSAAANAF